MATWEDVRRIALSLPETVEHPSYDGQRSWAVRKTTFSWERPLRKRDLEELGASAPTGPILGVRVHDLAEKEATLAAHADVCFTTSHFDNYAAVLVRLDEVDVDDLEELVTDAWVSRAPKRLVHEFEAGSNREPGLS